MGTLDFIHGSYVFDVLDSLNFCKSKLNFIVVAIAPFTITKMKDSIYLNSSYKTMFKFSHTYLGDNFLLRFLPKKQQEQSEKNKRHTRYKCTVFTFFSTKHFKNP